MPTSKLWPTSIARTAASIVSLMGLVVLIGWLFDIGTLKRILPHWQLMVPATALTFLLAGISLWTATAKTPKEHISQICAILVTAIGGIRLLSHFAGWNLGFDYLWFHPASYSGQMSPATALDFFVLGFALLIIHKPRHFGSFQSLALLGLLIGWLGFSRYFYGGESLAPFDKMAMHTALASIIFALGLLCVHPNDGLVGLLTSDSAGGVTVRRILPPAMLLPFILGWIRLHVQNAGWLSAEACLTVFSVINVLIIGGLVVTTSGFLHGVDLRRRRAEQTSNRLAAIVESSDDAIISKTLDGVITSWNSGAQRIFGYTEEEAIGKPMLMLIPPERAEEEPAVLARVLQGGHISHFETVRVKKDGSRISVSVTISPLRDDRGNVIGASKIARDITERKLAQEKIQAQLERLDLLQQTTRAIGERQDLKSIFNVVIRNLEDKLALDFCCICLRDPEHMEIIVNAVGNQSRPLAIELAMTEQSHISVDNNGLSSCLHGRLVYEPDISDSQFPFPQRLARGGLCAMVAAPLQLESKVFGVLIAARKKANSFSSGQCEFLRQLSEHVALASHQAQLYSELQQAYDNLRQSQQTALQQERLRALGQMASGIAHDINNAISPVSLYTESLLETEELSDRARGYLTTIQRSIDDVAETVSRMKEFYRQREPEVALVPIHLDQLLDQVGQLTRARWSDMPQERGIVINLDMDVARDLPPVMGVASEIREALTNLVFNAVDAMPQGGTIFLRAHLVNVSPVNSDPQPPPRVLVEVEDTGVGMDDDARRRCLEPFFTTKGERGTGLGLAMVYGTAQRHNAKIDIESASGKGTKIKLIFPVADPVAANAAPVDNMEETAEIPRNLRILIVDDDPVVIESLRHALEGDGHNVTSAGDGGKGIEAFQSALTAQEPFAVVITDLGMPYIDGRKVAGAIKASSPSTPVILLTGWGQRLVVEGDVPEDVDFVLNKPPKLRTVRTALAACFRKSPRSVGVTQSYFI